MRINPIADRPTIGILKNNQIGKADKNALTSLIDGANSSQKEADTMLAKMVKGEPVEAHDVMLSLRQAEAKFHLVLQVRNKLMEAYQEVMRNQF